RNPQARVVFDVKCTSHLAPWVEQHGGIADMQPTGHAFIKARMAETGALLGGEMSGHFYFRENWYGFDDALFAGARLAAILADNPDVFSDIPDSVSSPELQVDMSGKNQHEFIAALSQQADFPGAKQVVTIDGLRVEYEYGFGLVRASNTTPTLVLRFEARDNQHLELIKETFRQILHKADSSLILPF
nr:phosphomannomutase/phosphoglucomutase [Pseudomonadota bacterium]